jgi:hypothetical protein
MSRLKILVHSRHALFLGRKSFADTFSASTASVASEMSFGILIVLYALAFCEARITADFLGVAWKPCF